MSRVNGAPGTRRPFRWISASWAKYRTVKHQSPGRRWPCATTGGSATNQRADTSVPANPYRQPDPGCPSPMRSKVACRTGRSPWK